MNLIRNLEVENMRNLRLTLLNYFKQTSIPLLSSILILLCLASYAGADTNVGGTISTDTTWTLAGSPYIVTSNIFVQGTDGVDSVTTLTIEAGVTIKFNANQYLKIGHTSGSPGALMAIGTSANPIVFTSNAQTPAAGDWGSIQFYTTAVPSSKLEHCQVEYAGSSMNCSIYLFNASPTLNYTTIENSSKYDLYYYGTVGGTVSSCTFNSGISYFPTNATVAFSNNTFNHNSSYPTVTVANNVHGLVNGSNTYNDPQTAYIEVSTGDVTKDAIWTSAVALHFVGHLAVQGTDGPDSLTTLTLEPGAKLKFNTGKYMRVGYYSGNPGALIAQGTAAEPVIFTSNKPSPAPGDWGSIHFYATADPSSTLEHCRLEYAGASMNGSIYIYNAAPNIINTTIENSSRYDLYYGNSGTVGGTVSGCTFNSGIFLCTVNNEVNFSDNTFNHNSAYPTYTIANNVHNIVNGNNTFNDSQTAYINVASGNVTKDATWTSAVPLYFGNYFIVQGTDGADGITTLTLEPGAKIKFNARKYIKIGSSSGNPGAMIAQGTAENPVVFTSASQTPQPGDWQYVKFDTTSDPSSTMEHCRVEYAGSILQGSINIYKASPNISNTTVQNGKGHDLYFTGTVNGTVSGCTLNNGLKILTADAGINFTGNTFNQNNTYPIMAYADHVHGLLNGNTFNNVDESSFLHVMDGNVTKDATWTSNIPIYLAKNLTITGNDGADGITTLSIEPGAKILFEPGRLLNVGNGSGSPGALSAQGSAENMITFTSNKSSPSPGDWSGLRFLYTSNDGTSVLKYCVVEYAGSNGLYSLGLYDAKPTIERSIIRYSSKAGLYAYGAGSSNALISCNTFTNNNTYGVYLGNNALPLISGNNFLENSQNGLYNSVAAQVNAENNWWGDAAGPNTTGDSIYGNVDADPWSLAENACIVVQENNPPNTPGSPNPADNAVRVALADGSQLLQWTGGDPDLQDTVTYDLKSGISPDTLSMTTQDIIGNEYLLSGLSDGITYYWQITAKDSHGLEAVGPVWRFTSDGDTPDLVVDSLTTDPGGNLQAGQSVTITAMLGNNGTGPVVDPFSVNLLINGASIGEVAVDSIILAGNSLTVNWTWTYDGGDPTIQVVVDSQGQVSETSEGNNQYSALLSTFADMTAPALTSTAPSGGAFLQQIQQVSLTLNDSQSTVDDTAVMASFALTDANQQAVPGAISESNDTFTFVPTALPLADNIYQVSVASVDEYGNTQNHSYTFTIDATPPQKPIITGGSVASGMIQARPEVNSADQFLIELTGARDSGTSVWINGELKVGFGDTDWSVELVLQSGVNAIEIWLHDRAGNQGPSEWVDVEVITSDAITYEYDAAGRVERIHSNP